MHEVWKPLVPPGSPCATPGHDQGPTKPLIRFLIQYGNRQPVIRDPSGAKKPLGPGPDQMVSDGAMHLTQEQHCPARCTKEHTESPYIVLAHGMGSWAGDSHP